MNKHRADPWRLLWTPPERGSKNMAIDDAIVEEVGKYNSLPTIRFYTWDPPCLSLGYTQPLVQADLARISEAGWDLVRRPTGGRAILHTDELTYSISAPLSESLVSGGVLASYRRISKAIIHGLRLLDLPIETKEHTQTVPHAQQEPVCFEVPSVYEITALGKKLVGSAQVRRKNAVLQHGTIPLTGDISRICNALYFSSDAERKKAVLRVHERAITVEKLVGKQLDPRVVGETIAAGFREVFDLTLEEAPLTGQENKLALQLEQDRYSHADWTNRI
ncbi:MAG: lipoate--protein ligase family protein [Anaerolineales bacterium]|nr:lipoate--protein ligase family protein [Anaerolineales bacterium]